MKKRTKVEAVIIAAIITGTCTIIAALLALVPNWKATKNQESEPLLSSAQTDAPYNIKETRGDTGQEKETTETETTKKKVYVWLEKYNDPINAHPSWKFNTGTISDCLNITYTNATYIEIKKESQYYWLEYFIDSKFSRFCCTIATGEGILQKEEVTFKIYLDGKYFAKEAHTFTSRTKAVFVYLDVQNVDFIEIVVTSEDKEMTKDGEKSAPALYIINPCFIE